MPKARIGLRKGFMSIAIAALGLLLVPVTALGSTVATSGNTLKVSDPLNVAQATTVNFNGATGVFGLSDGGGAMTAVAPCVANGAGTAVQCPGAGITRISIDGAGGIDDLLIDPTVPASVRTLLQGGVGADVLTGGLGADLLVGGDGPDTFIGGPGVDTVSYVSHTVPAVHVRMRGGPVSGNAVDGPPGGRDRITATVEGVIGSSSSDVIFGDGSANIIRGKGGLDKIAAKAGRDRLFGGPRRDVLRGGGGPDRIVGEGGGDIMSGMDGSDRLLANDGAADLLINCGNGNGEFADVDALDPAPISC
jgi:hypothetical protein